jgi:hypothetical protein
MCFVELALLHALGVPDEIQLSRAAGCVPLQANARGMIAAQHTTEVITW